MQRVIVITSGKGGVGKTTVCASIGKALSKLGKKVLLVEGDIGLNNLDVVLQVEDKIIYDASDVVRGKASAIQAVIEVDKNLFLFPSTNISDGLITTENFVKIIEELKTEFNYVIIESPAGIESNFYRAIASAEESLLVVTPHLSSVRDGAKTIRMLNDEGITKVGLIVNRVRGEFVIDKSTLSPDEIAEITGIPLYGVIPEDDSINKNGMVHFEDKRNGAGFSYRLIAEYIDGKDKKIYNCENGHNGLISRVKRWLAK